MCDFEEEYDNDDFMDEKWLEDKYDANTEMYDPLDEETEPDDEHDKAVSDYTTTIRLKPNQARVYHNRGLAWKKKGDEARADADFKKAQELGYKP